MEEKENFTKYQIKNMLTYMVSFEKVWNTYSDTLMSGSGSCFCPFHDNENTKAAKFYRESNSLYCWGCHKYFTVYDLLLEYNIDPIDTFHKLWDAYSDARKQYILQQVGKPYSVNCDFKDSLISYDNGFITYDDLCLKIYDSIDGLKNSLIVLYNLSRPITEKKLDKLSDYLYLGAYKQNQHIRNITSGEIIGHTSQLSRTIVNFIKEHNDVTIIFNMFHEVPVGATIRGNKSKVFMDIGNKSGIMYNLLNLKDFKKNDPIYLVEGPKDCEAFKIYFKDKHCLSLMTSGVTRAQLLVLRALTDKIALCLDNDKVGQEACDTFIKKYSGIFKIERLAFPPILKDFGDMITLYRKDKNKFKEAYKFIDEQFSSFTFV